MVDGGTEQDLVGCKNTKNMTLGEAGEGGSASERNQQEANDQNILYTCTKFSKN